jgi:hypothetical protein
VIGPAAGSLGDPAAVPLLPGRALLASGLALPSSARPCDGPPGSAAGDMPRVRTWSRGTCPVVAPISEDMSSGRLPQQGTCPVLRSANGHEGSMSTRAGQQRACPAVTSFSGGHAPRSHVARGDMSSLRCGAEGVGTTAQLQDHKAIPRCASKGAGHAHWPAWGGGPVHSWCWPWRPCSFWVRARVGMLIGRPWGGGPVHSWCRPWRPCSF